MSPEFKTAFEEWWGRIEAYQQATGADSFSPELRAALGPPPTDGDDPQSMAALVARGYVKSYFERGGARKYRDALRAREAARVEGDAEAEAREDAKVRFWDDVQQYTVA